MQINRENKLEKIFTALSKMDKYPKAVIKYGSQIFLFLFASGTFLMAYNLTMQKFDSYCEFVATSIVKTSFIILAEAVIGGLIIDYVFKK
jgi:hypothetical protein